MFFINLFISRELSGHFILKTVASLAKNLGQQMDLFFLDCQSSHLVTSLPGFVKQRKDKTLEEVKDQIVKAQCTLTYLCDNIAIETARNNQNDHLVSLVKNVGSVFHEIVEIMLGLQIDLCLKRMKGETLNKSLRLMTDLAVVGHSLCRLLVQHGTVRQLVKILQKNPSRNLLMKKSREKQWGSLPS